VAFNVQNDLKETLLHFAALGGKTDILKVLLSHSPDVNQRTTTGWTPLMFALAPDRRPEERLDYKTIFQATRTARLLLEYGADASVVADGGWTPLHVLGLHKDTRISPKIIGLTNQLLQQSNGINALEPIPTDTQWHGRSKLHRSWDDQGRNMTLLHWAAEHGCTAMVQVLIDNGADVLARDTRLLTPAMVYPRSSVID
jgi:ankyrin repeat protein